MDTPAINVLSLCSGVGGLDLGIDLATGGAARTVCCVERDAACAAILAARMAEGALAEAPVWSDLRTFDGRAWRGVVDILIGGYPCQPARMASDLEGAIRGTFGPTWRESLRRRSPASVFSRTSPDIFGLGLSMFGMTFSEWATELQRDCLRRLKSAQRSGVGGYSFWPNALARDWKGRGSMLLRSDYLDYAAEQWTAVSESSRPRRVILAGARSCWHGRTLRPRLNPAFDEWLMGWPRGWTEFGNVATELCRYRRRMRSRLCSLAVSDEWACAKSKTASARSADTMGGAPRMA